MEAGRVARVDDEEGPKALHGEIDQWAMPLVVQCATHKGGGHCLLPGVDVAPNNGFGCHQK